MKYEERGLNWLLVTKALQVREEIGHASSQEDSFNPSLSGSGIPRCSVGK